MADVVRTLVPNVGDFMRPHSPLASTMVKIALHNEVAVVPAYPARPSRCRVQVRDVVVAMRAIGLEIE